MTTITLETHYLTVEQAAAYMGVSRDFIRAEMKRRDGNHLRHLEIGNVCKVRREALIEHFMELEI